MDKSFHFSNHSEKKFFSFFKKIKLKNKIYLTPPINTVITTLHHSLKLTCTSYHCDTLFVHTIFYIVLHHWNFFYKLSSKFNFIKVDNLSWVYCTGELTTLWNEHLIKSQKRNKHKPQLTPISWSMAVIKTTTHFLTELTTNLSNISFHFFFLLHTTHDTSVFLLHFFFYKTNLHNIIYLTRLRIIC